MKILHILPSREKRTGVSVAAIDTILALQEQEEVKQSVVCRPHESFLVPLLKSKIPVMTFDFNKWNKWFMKKWIPYKISHEIKSQSPDVIHCWGTQATIFLLPSGIPSLEWDANVLALKQVDVCDYYICVNRRNFKEVKAYTGRPDCVFLSYPFGTLQQDATLSREEFGIPATKPVVLMLSRMSREKGVDLLLWSAVKLDVFLLLVGDGPDLEDYRQLAKDLKIDSRVRFIGWRKDRSALLDLADILAIPSRRESFGAVMPEAWHKSVPVVASRTDGPLEHIQHGVNGMLSDIEDVNGFAENLRMVLEDNNLRKKLIAGGTNTYKTQFSKDVVIDNLLKIYEEVIRRGVIKNK